MKAIEIYADGACAPNPGSMGIGVVLKYGEKTKEISRLIGPGTNNIAELSAIKIGLESIKDRSLPVTIFSDSQYAIKSISGEWNGPSNRELIREIQEILNGFESVDLKWIRGHAGNLHQERADYLANKDLPDELKYRYRRRR